MTDSRTDVAPLLAKVIPEKSATHLFAAHTAAAKNILPRLAGILEVSQVSMRAWRSPRLEGCEGE